MKQDEIRARLIDGTIHVIARDGLDKASAKQIESETGINVVYIYRCFKDKEDMFAKAFSSLDNELIGELMKRLPIMWTPELSMEERCRLLFSAVWKFLLRNKEKCICFTRYYYSPYFQKYSYEAHRAACRIVVDKMSVAFKDEANVWMILNHILNVMLDFAVKVHNGQMSSDDDYSEHVFRVIYASVKQYFKKNEESDS